VPSNLADQLQAEIADPTSAFYTQAPNNVAKQLAANVDPSFNILVGGGQAKSSIVTGSQSPNNSNATLRNALIGVAAALVAVIAGVIGWRVWRKQQKAKAPPRPQAGLGRNNTIRSFGGNGGGLRDRARVRGRLRLELGHRLDQPRRAAGIADPPAGHRIGLRAAVDGQRALEQLGARLGDGRELEAVIDDMLVHIVGEDPDMRVLREHRAQSLQLVDRVAGAGRV